jgi:hypothetical protein
MAAKKTPQEGPPGPGLGIEPEGIEREQVLEKFSVLVLGRLALSGCIVAVEEPLSAGLCSNGAHARESDLTRCSHIESIGKFQFVLPRCK